MLPLVSVIIPTYDRWPMLREAALSVLAQSFREFELIVVDDGSTDGSAEKLAKIASNIRIVSQARRGVAAARNRGAELARGRYLAFLDSDDLWLPEKLEVQTEMMERCPDVQVCQTEEIWIRRGVRVNPKLKHRKLSGDIFRQSLELCLISPSAVMMTAKLFAQAGGFDERFPVCEDYDLWLRLTWTHSVALIPQPLVVKRGGHADQLSRSVWGMDRFRVQALQKLLRAGLEGERRAWVVAALKRKVAVLSSGARKRGKFLDAASYDAIEAEFAREAADARS